MTVKMPANVGDAWHGVDADIVVANAAGLSLSSSAPGSGELWQRAALAVSRPPIVLVAPRSLHILAPAGSWYPPETTVTPRAIGGDVARAALADPRAYGAIRRVIGKRCGDRPARLWAQVWTESVRALARALDESGCRIDPSLLPKVSGGSIAYLNTKIGGDAFLRQLPGVKPYVPASTVCYGVTEAATVVAGSPHTALVVKPDGSSGGAGISVFAAGRRITVEKIADTISETLPSTRAYPREPLIIQTYIGDEATNRSPSLDFWVGPDSLCVAFVDQRLDGPHYSGSSWPSRVSGAAAATCRSIGGEIAAALARVGYVGLLNVDFVVDAHDSVFVAEINVRQSAPLDQSLIFRRLARGGSRAGWFAGMESVDDVALGELERNSPKVIPVAREGSRTVTVLVLGDDEAETDEPHWAARTTDS